MVIVAFYQTVGERMFKHVKMRNGEQHCRNLAFSGRARETHWCLFEERKMRRSHHQRLFEENVRKTKKGSVNFKNKGSRVVYVWGRY